MNRRDDIRRWLLGAAFAWVSGLAACGGSDAPQPMIGPAGGTVAGPAGAQVVVPAGALAQATAVAVASSSTGSPALPAGLAVVGDLFAFTPHGTTFTSAVTVSVPYDAGRVPAGATPVLYKTNASGGWDAIVGARFVNGMASASIDSFSWVVVGLLPPQITQQPASISVQEPDTATFSVTALGAPPFTYQWQRSDNAGTTWADIPGATARTYTTGATSRASDDADRYRVIVSNTDGPSTSTEATLTVTVVVTMPTFTTQPTPQTAAVGATATFSAVATGTNLVYRWQKSGVPIDIALNPSAANASLSLANVQTADAADYAVVVSNLIAGVPSNSITSTAAHLTVTTVPPPAAGASAHLAAGTAFSAALNAAGAPYSWGSDDSGTLGNGGADLARNTATLMGTINAVVRSVAASSLHGAMLLSDGSALAWGYNTCVFDGSTGANIFLSSHPVLVSALFGFTTAATGSDHLLLLKANGSVQATGCNASGQLGYAPGTPAALVVAGLPSIKALAAGGSFSLALDGSGNVWSWGSGALGDGTPIGQPGAPGRATPMKVLDRAGTTPVIAIAAGREHALALTSDGTVLAWGRNTNGKLGDGTDTDRLAPTPTLVVAGSGVIAIAAGAENSVALRGSDGVVLSWGINETGQLGNGGTAPGSRFQPAPVIGLSGVVEVAFGSGALGHGLARKADGSVWAWGHNSDGQLGNGSAAPFSASPVQVLSAPGVPLNLN